MYCTPEVTYFKYELEEINKKLKRQVKCLTSQLEGAASQLASTNFFLFSFGVSASTAWTTMATPNAAGESLTIIGTVRTIDRLPRTISAAGGGRILWYTNTAVTFADPGTTLRVGLQDVGLSGVESGVFDVYADYVGGTDTLNVSTGYRKAMTSGSKTVNDGDTIALSIEMVSRAGSDSVSIRAYNSTFSTIPAGFPYRTIDNGVGPTSTAAGASAVGMIEFDDGTIGYIEGAALWPSPSGTSQVFTYNASQTPDEYAVCFQVPFTMSVDSVQAGVSGIDSPDNYEIIIYRDALTTPTAIQTIIGNTENFGTTASSGSYLPIPVTQFEPGIWYAYSLRPTTANSVVFQYWDLGSGLEKYKQMSPFGSNLLIGARTDQTGAFTEVQPHYMPIFGLRIIGVLTSSTV
jgi:hypothetical protein